MTSVPPNNPLLSTSFSVPFHEIAPAHVGPAIRFLLQNATQALEAIENSNGPRTYDNTLKALDESTVRLSTAMGLVGHLETVASTPELREAYNAVRPDVSAFYAGIPLRKELWAALKAYAATQDAQGLTGPKARHLELTLNDFRRSGADLAPPEKRRLEQISRELAELTSKFSQNVLDETSAFELIIEDQDKLAGLPASAIAAAEADAKAKGKAGYRFTLQAPSVIPILNYLDDRAIREKVWKAYNTRCSGGPRDNVEGIRRILALRDEQAKLLGYSDFAAMVLEDRMAKKTETATEFVEHLRERTAGFFAAETQTLENFAGKLPGAPEGGLAPWDVAYYSEKQRRALYDFDEELLRPYFSVPAVLDGLFETARRLYGIQIEANSELPVWHADVRGFDIRDSDGVHLASFYADLFPREEKRGGAWMDSFISGVVDEQTGAMTPHLGLICANVTPPIGDIPALLTHNDVLTMFHEFGHLLHHCLSRVSVRSLVGTNVPWDFVELPSQIMENWCWEKEALDTFARHYETGTPIPPALFEKMNRARTYRSATAMMRQLSFAAVDLALHVQFARNPKPDLLGFAREIMQTYAPTSFPPDYAMLASFTHLFSSAIGYAAGYYSYKWAEVLDADAFTRFKSEGVFSSKTGLAFLHTILERGNTSDPMELYREFMGREPSLDALMARSGLIKAA